MDIVLPPSVLDALDSYFVEYASDAPSYSLLVDREGNIVWRKQVAAKELGVGQPCIFQGDDGSLQCATQLPVPMTVLNQLGAWAAAMRTQMVSSISSHAARTLRDDGLVLAKALATLLGDESRVFYYPYIADSARHDRWCYLVDKAGVSLKVSECDMRRAHSLVRCLSPLLSEQQLDLPVSEISRRILRLFMTRMPEDAMVATWMAMHDYGSCEVVGQRLHLIAAAM